MLHPLSVHRVQAALRDDDRHVRDARGAKRGPVSVAGCLEELNARPHGLGQALQIERFQEVSEGSGLECLCHDRLALATEHDHADPRIFSANAPQHLDTVHAREADVEHDEIRASAANGLQGLLAVGRLQDGKSFALKVVDQQAPDLLFIIDDKNLAH